MTSALPPCAWPMMSWHLRLALSCNLQVTASPLEATLSSQSAKQMQRQQLTRDIDTKSRAHTHTHTHKLALLMQEEASQHASLNTTLAQPPLHDRTSPYSHAYKLELAECQRSVPNQHEQIQDARTRQWTCTTKQKLCCSMAFTLEHHRIILGKTEANDYSYTLCALHTMSAEMIIQITSE